MVSEKAKSIVRNITLAGIIIFFGVLATQTLGLGRTGFDTQTVLTQQFFYVGPAIAFLVGIFLLFAAELSLTKGDDKYGNSVAFNDPGQLPSPLGKFVRGSFKLILLSVIIFGILGIIAVVGFNQTSFTGVGSTSQQFTVVDNIIYSSALVPSSENLGAAFFFAFMLFLWRQVCRKNNVSKGAFVLVAIVLALVTFLGYGYTNHLLRYSASEVALQNVLLFWGIGGFVTVITGSFIPFWIMHILNNVFYELAKNFSSDMVVIYTGAMIAAAVVLYLLIYVRKGGKKDVKQKMEY